MIGLRRLALYGAVAAAFALPALAPSPAQAWWGPGYGWHHPGWGWRRPVVVVPGPVYGPRPYVVGTPVYAPGYHWIPPHYTPGGYFVRGHWGY